MGSLPGPNPIVQVMKMTRFEWRIGSRTVAWRLFVAAFFLYGCSLGHIDGNLSGGVAYAAGESGWKLVGLVAVVWMSMLGAREMAMRTRTVVFAKPQPAENLVLSRYLGAMFQICAFLVAMFLGALIMRLAAGSSPKMVSVFIPQFSRALGVVFVASTASFTLASLSESIIAGMLVCLYLVLASAGKSFLAKYFDPSPIQNVYAYVSLAAAFLCAVMLLYARKRRGNAAAPIWIPTLAVIFVSLTCWMFYLVVAGEYDGTSTTVSALSLMQSQDSTIGVRAAGSSLPDQDGKLAGIGQYAGKILTVALWSPQDPDSDQLLSHLNSIQAKYRAMGVRVVAICLSEDNSAARTFAIGDDLQFPVVTDWGATSVPEKLGMSPMASAYRVVALPMVSVTDRRRRVVDSARATGCYDGVTLDRLVATEVTTQQ